MAIMFLRHTLRQWAALVAAAGLLAASAAWAQPATGSQGPVLKGSQVTEDALVDALAIEGPAATGATRGFRPAPAGEKPKPYGPGKANLLITFVTGSSDLTAESQSILDTLAKAMQSDTLAGLSFRVEGHADARGDPERNKALSLARAESVAGYLSTKHGVLPDRLKPIGKGSAEPMNAARVDAPENRRVTIVSTRE
jgi:outer membrane protein OmpA-like peptidoglycan-associated protein